MCSIVEYQPSHCWNEKNLIGQDDLTRNTCTYLPLSTDIELDNNLLNTKLLLVNDFQELNQVDRSVVHSLRLYLTSTKIIVAENTVEGNQGHHIRSHLIKEILVEREATATASDDMNVMKVIGEHGDVFLYKFISKKQSDFSLWLSNIYQLKRTSDSPSSNDESSTSKLTQPTTPNTPAFKIRRPSNEWHGESYVRYHSVPPSAKLCDLEEDSPSHSNFHKSSILKRRGAFRMQQHMKNSPISSSRSHDKLNQRQTSSPVSVSSDTLLSPISPIVKEFPVTTSSAPTSLRKKKLKFSRKFARALSARLTSTITSSNALIGSSSAHQSPDLPKKSFRRGSSFHSTRTGSLSLPRPTKSKLGKRNKSVAYDMIPMPEPVTPKPPKSPGSLLKIFHRNKRELSDNSISSFFNEIDGETITDLYNKPNTSKLYLQNQKEVAIQLTLLDAELFQNISLSELSDGAWTKKDKYNTSPNVLKMIESFNRLALVVCTEIVHEKTIQGRAKAIGSYIQLADKCYKLHNYNSMKAVISGLQSQAIYRLKRSWNHVTSKRKKKFEKLSNLLCDLNNVELLKHEMSVNLQSDVCCIPYLGWLLTNIMHWQTYDKLHISSTHRRSASVVERRKLKRKSWRESTCSISLPTSPVLSDNEDKDRPNDDEEHSTFTNDMSLYQSIQKALSKSFIDNNPESHHPLQQSSPIKPQLSSDIFLDSNPTTDSIIKQLFIHGSSSDTSTDDRSVHDSAICLDSNNTSQNSPFRIGNNQLFTAGGPSGMRLKSNSPSVPSGNFESESENEDSINTHSKSKINFIESLSSSSASLISTSMITLSLTQRSLSLPDLHKMSHQTTDKPSSYHDLQGGVLFTTCDLKSSSSSILTAASYKEIDTTATLKSAAKQLIQSSENNNKLSSETNFLLLEDNNCTTPTIQSNMVDSEKYQEVVRRSIVTSPIKDCNTLTNNSIMETFQRYQDNSYTYSTEFPVHPKIRRLILKTPWVDEKECHNVSLKAESTVP